MKVKRLVKTFLLITIFTLLFSINVVAAPTDTTKENFKIVAENSRLELWIDELCAQIEVIDKDTDMVWSSSISDETFDITTLNKNFQKRLKSLFEISYTDLKKGYGAVMTNSLADIEYTTTVESITNGVKVYYDLKGPAVKIAIEFILEEDRLTVNIPQEDFQEYGAYSVTSLRMLPYLLGAPDNVDGFYFFPDGSGAIMEFKDPSHFGESEMVLNVYGDLKNYSALLSDWIQEEPTVMIPVFGAAIEDEGVLAVITKGEEASQIKLLPTNNVVPVNRLNCEFIFRRNFIDQRVSDKSVVIFDNAYIKEDRSVSYIFLEEKKNTYSDMAVKYREYLMETQNLMVKKDDKVKVSIDLFMGIKERGMLFDVFKSVTTFSQAQSILESLQKAGVELMDVQLKGWMKNGYDSGPVQFPVNSKLGGTKGLNGLIDYAIKNNINLSLIADLVEANSKYGGFSKRNDVVYLGNKAILTNYKQSKFLLAPSAFKNKFDSFLNKIEDFKLTGVQLENIGQSVIYNYNSDKYQTAKECLETYTGMLSRLNTTYRNTTVEGGNAYVIPYVDKVTNIPMSDTGFQLTTKAVPFYQIAFHGIVGYTGTAGNLTSDLEKEKLKWIELGYMPYFELTYKGSEALMDTKYNKLFSSGYYEWGDSLIEIYKEFNTNLQDVWNQTIEKHEEIKEDVYKVTYLNGTCIYVNYNKNSVSVDGLKVEAMNYVIKAVK